MERIRLWRATRGTQSFAFEEPCKLTVTLQSRIQLYADDADPSSPIARFQMSRKSSDRPAALLLDARALEIRDIVVLSFLFLEKSRRATHNSTQHKADVLGTPYVSPNNFQAIKNGGV